MFHLSRERLEDIRRAIHFINGKFHLSLQTKLTHVHIGFDEEVVKAVEIQIGLSIVCPFSIYCVFVGLSE